MKIAIRHELTFSLGAPTRALAHLLLTALPTAQQKIERWSIEMPGIASAALFRDGYGNKAQLVSLVKPEGPLTITVAGVVETIDKAGVLGRIDLDPMPAMFRRPMASAPADPVLLAGLKPDGDRIATLHELMGRIHAAETPPAHSQSQSQSQGGQSQSSGATAEPKDQVHAFIGAARALEIPARYVTGYLVDDDGIDGGFHAWAEAWDEGLGWIGFDPARDECPAELYVRLASGLDATSSVPVRTVPVWDAMPVEVVSVGAV